MKDGFSGQRMIVLPQAVIQKMEQHEHGRELYITEMGYFPKATHHFRDRPEGIGEYIFIYCVDGLGWIEVRGERKDVPSNHFCIIPKGAPCRYAADERNPWTIYWMHIKGNKAEALAQLMGMGEVKNINVEEGSRIRDRIQLFEEIYNTLDYSYSTDNLFYAQTVLHHFLGSLLYIKQFRQSAYTYQKEHSVADSAIHFMRENLEKDIDMDKVAKFTGYGISQFNALFKQQTGLSPKHYFLQLKIREASKYLLLTDVKINQLCYKVGIEDPFYFTRLFTKIMGCSPSEYRKQKK